MDATFGFAKSTSSSLVRIREWRNYKNNLVLKFRLFNEMLLQESRKLSSVGLYEVLVRKFCFPHNSFLQNFMKRDYWYLRIIYANEKDRFSVENSWEKFVIILSLLGYHAWWVIEITSIILQSIRFLRAPGPFLRAYMSCRKNEINSLAVGHFGWLNEGFKHSIYF